MELVHVSSVEIDFQNKRRKPDNCQNKNHIDGYEIGVKRPNLLCAARCCVFDFIVAAPHQFSDQIVRKCK